MSYSPKGCKELDTMEVTEYACMHAHSPLKQVSFQQRSEISNARLFFMRSFGDVEYCFLDTLHFYTSFFCDSKLDFY